MRIIKSFYKYAVIFILCFNASIAKITKSQVMQDYNDFKQNVYPQISEKACNTPYANIGAAVAFANAYNPQGATAEEKAELKYKIFSTGWGVGGVSTRKATPEERAVMFTTLKERVAPYIQTKQPCTAHQTLINQAIQTFHKKEDLPKIQKTILSWVDDLTCAVKLVGSQSNPYYKTLPKDCLTVMAQLYDTVITSSYSIDMNFLKKSVERCRKTLESIEDDFWNKEEIEVLAKLSSPRWKDFKDKMARNPLAPENLSMGWQAFTLYLQELTKEIKNDFSRSESIQALATVSSKQWETFIQEAKTLTEGMKDDFARGNSIQALATVSPEQWKTFIQEAKTLTEGMQEDFVRSNSIEALAIVSPEQWKTFIQEAKTLTEGMKDDFARSDSIQSLARVPFKHRKSFVQEANILTKGKVYDYGRNRIIYFLSTIIIDQPKMWETFVQETKILTKGMMYDDALVKSIPYLAQVAIDQPKGWKAFVQETKTLTEGMKDDDKCSVSIQTLAQVVIDQPKGWKIFVQEAKTLTEGMQEDFARSNSIQALSKVPFKQWTVFTQKARKLIEKMESDFVRSQCIENLVKEFL